MRSSWCAVLLMLVLPWPALAASEPAQSATADRIALARNLAHGGDSDGAVAQWLAIEAEATRRGDAALRDQADIALADLAFLQGDYEEFSARQNALLERARARGDQLAAARAQMQLAVLERRIGRLEEARAGFERVLAIFRGAGNRDGEAVALTHLALVLLNQGAYSETLEALERSLALQREGAAGELDRTYHYLGLLYLGLREFDVARGHLERGLAEAARLSDPMRASPLIGSLARVANEQGLHADALAYSQRSAQLSRQFDSAPGLVYSALERGRALLGLGRLPEARESLQEAIARGEAIAQDRTVADARFSLGRLALREGRPDDALALFEQAFPSYEAANDVPQVLESYRMMVPLLRERGDFARALQLSETSLRLQEQISGRDMNRRLALAEYRHQSEEAERRIELLTRDNEIQALRLREVYLTRRFGLALLGGLVLLSLVLAIRYRESRRHARHLADVNQALHASRESLAVAHRELEQRNHALYTSSITDPLTGVFNRGHAFERLFAALRPDATGSGRVGVLLFDVDHFKRVNDEHGHVMGDAVLRRVARVVAAELPDAAVFGRFGGEEFLVIVPGATQEQALALGERLRRAVAEAPDPVGPAVTVSIGVATAACGTECDRLIEAADEALYRAKRGGRNRVEAAAAVVVGLR
jgi:diguanylate cyclase (GGDEF)-like protein